MADHENTDINLIRVAQRQRTLLWIILAAVLVYPLAIALATVSPVGGAIVLLFQLGLQIAGLVQVVRLFAALKTGIMLRIIYIVLLFIPLINLVVLLVASGQATSVLKLAGANVGLMGVPKSEYPKLTEGNCRGCGYDRRGLELLQPCPECGRQPRIV